MNKIFHFNIRIILDCNLIFIDQIFDQKIFKELIYYPLSNLITNTEP